MVEPGIWSVPSGPRKKWASLVPSETNTGVPAVRVTRISPVLRDGSTASWAGGAPSYRRILLEKGTKL